MTTGPSPNSSVIDAVPGFGAADELALEPVAAGFESLVHAVNSNATNGTNRPTHRTSAT